MYGCAYWPVAEEADIAAYGFDDSKALTEEKRDSLFAKMKACGRIGWTTHSLTAREIAAAMLHRQPISLNVLSHDAAMSMLEAVLASGVRVTRVFVDTVGDPGVYEAKFNRIFNQGAGGGGGTAGRGWAINFTVSKKADSLYKTVSAASIAAKVTRDRAIRTWVFDEPAFAHMRSAVDEAAAVDAAAFVPEEEDEDEDEDDVIAPNAAKKAKLEAGAAATPEDKKPAPAKAALKESKVLAAKRVLCLHPSSGGSGYPSDPLTKAWMVQHMDRVFGWPSVCRFSWAPAKDALENGGVACDWDDDEASVGGPSQARLGAFFSATTTGGGGKTAWQRKRGLAPVFDL